jgi:cell division protein ZapA
MGEVTLNIHGKNYGIACDNGQEDRVTDVGAYVDSRAREISEAGAASNENHLLVLTALVLADEIKELRETLRSNGRVSYSAPDQKVVYQGMSPEEQQTIIQSIERLSNRIESVTGRLKAA